MRSAFCAARIPAIVLISCDVNSGIDYEINSAINIYATGQGLVTPETMQNLTTARASGDMGYAGGWMVVTKPKGTMLVYSGSNTMWYATAVVIPTQQLALAIVTNKGDPAVEESLESLVARFLK